MELVPEGKALHQLRDRAYADKYRARGEPIHLIGSPMKFSETPVDYRYAPPTLGQHTEEVKRRLEITSAG